MADKNTGATVDVLYVMDRLVALSKEIDVTYSIEAQKQDAREAQYARDAVAELIAADKEYDTARSRYDHAFRDGPHGDLQEQRASQKMLREAKTRRADALARVGGGK